MMRATWFRSACVLLAVFVLSCLPELPSRVREGQLYRPGHEPYDTYFRDVYTFQSGQASWKEEKARARGPLTSELKLDRHVPDTTLTEVAHEKVGALGPVGTKLDIKEDNVEFSVNTPSEGARKLKEAIEGTSRAELLRAKRFRSLAAKIEQVLAHGRELETKSASDFAKHGGRKPAEVKNEFSASFDVLDSVLGRAREEARATEHFLANLSRSVSIGQVVNSAPAPTVAPSQTPPPARPRPARPASPPKSDTQPPATAPPPPAPKPPPKPPTEEFNP